MSHVAVIQPDAVVVGTRVRVQRDASFGAAKIVAEDAPGVKGTVVRCEADRNLCQHHIFVALDEPTTSESWSVVAKSLRLVSGKSEARVHFTAISGVAAVNDPSGPYVEIRCGDGVLIKKEYSSWQLTRQAASELLALLSD